MSANASRLLESAITCHERGEYDTAENYYQQALEAEPDNVYIVHSAAILALQTNDFPLASARLRRALELGVSRPDTYFMLGRALKAQGDIEGAIGSYRLAIKLAPGMSAAHVSLGLALKEQGRLPEAAESYREALLVNPSSFEARLNLGNALQLQGRFDEALAEYEKASELRPESPQLHYNIGKVLRAQQRDADAAERFQKALLLDPDYLEAYYNLANALTTIGQYPAATDCYRHLQTLLKAGAGRLDDPEARERLKQDVLTGIVGPLAWSARYDEALPILFDALKRDPNSVLLHEYNLLMLPYRCEKRDEFLEAYVRYQRIMPLRDIQPSATAPRPGERQRLRIGYVSGDFRDHSVSFFIEPVLANHDRQSYEIACYSTNNEDDHVTERLKSYADLWVDAKELDDTALARRIADDEVDILVDLSGRTVQNRLGVFAKHPSLLQVGYLGYPTYTGVPQIAYRITDVMIDPEGENGLESERPLRLPHSMFCYRPPADAPACAHSSAQERGYVCFGSFNQVQKLGPTVLAAWARILKAIPDARLLLKAIGFTDAQARQRVIEVFTREGIAPERVMIRTGAPVRRDHLATYNEIDIALDTFPYNGATTTCEALWMGTPVITLAGETHPSRMGASLLTALNLRELITHSADEYIAAVVRLAGDPQGLNELRGNLRLRLHASQLCDEKGYTEAYERALRDAWRLRAAQRAGAENRHGPQHLP